MLLIGLVITPFRVKWLNLLILLIASIFLNVVTLITLFTTRSSSCNTSSSLVSELESKDVEVVSSIIHVQHVINFIDTFNCLIILRYLTLLNVVTLILSWRSQNTFPSVIIQLMKNCFNKLISLATCFINMTNGLCHPQNMMMYQ